MEFDQYGVIKVAGAEPETFTIAFLNSALPAYKPFMKTSEFMEESQLRVELAKMGFAAAKIESLIRQARENPR